MKVNDPLALLGDLSPQTFMRRHWQKKPLVIRQAIPQFVPPVQRGDLLDLAAQDEVQSRLIVQVDTNSKVDGNNKAKGNWKLRQQGRYLEAIERIQSFGITVNGCFILGLDGDTPTVFDDVLAFARQSGLYEVQVTFLTAFPGTPLYRRLKDEGRLLRDSAWETCTLFDINFQPRGMTVDQLQAGFLKLVKQLFSSEETATRRRLFRQRLRRSPNFGRGARTDVDRLAA